MKRRAARAISKIAKSAPKPRPDALIDPKVLQELVDVFHSAGVADLEVERGGLRVRLRRQEAVVADGRGVAREEICDARGMRWCWQRWRVSVWLIFFMWFWVAGCYCCSGCLLRLANGSNTTS